MTQGSTSRAGWNASEPICPVCGTRCPGEPVAAFTADEAARLWAPPERDADRHRRLAACIRRLWSSDRAILARCPSCGFGFGWPHVGGDGEFYAILHESAGYPPWRWEYEVLKQRAETDLFNGGIVLDIGAGDGAFLKSLPEKWTKCAIESTDAMRATLAQAGMRVFRDENDAIASLGGRVQLITLFQVLEHIATFRDMLARVGRLLAPGGMLAVSTPNAEELFRQMRVTRHPDMPPNHINQWTPKSIALAMEQCGFSRVETLREPGGLRHVPYVLYLRARADAWQRPHSLAAFASRMRRRSVRALLLRAAGLAALPGMLPRFGSTLISGNMLTLARAGRA